MLGAFRSLARRAVIRPAVMPSSLSFSSSSSVNKMRNIGISAHIDSGKTTLTERILFYTGRINAIHDVRGKDGVGAKMDSMDLERERGITIQSAATFTSWKDYHINIIDTPGHVDFTIEVERALRVLDGAVMVVCSVGGVQSQTLTVDRQMKRYNVPRIAFINKCDRGAANPFKCIEQMNEELDINATAVQYPIGLEKDHRGVVDLLKMKALLFEGEHGEIITEADIPADLLEEVQEHRQHLIDTVADVDEEVGEAFLMEEEITEDMLRKAIRRATIANTFTPVFMGSAYKNRGIQPLLDGVLDFLPEPNEVVNKALDLENSEEEVILDGKDKSKPLVALAFKLEEGKYGQLTYVRNYQGVLKKGATIINSKDGEKQRVPRLVRMHSDEMEEIDELPAGEIGAVFGLECDSGTTFTDGKVKYSMTSMFVPEPVISLSVAPREKGDRDKLGKALSRFTREDPTFRSYLDEETNETIIAGMGELHLQVYVERIKREYNVDAVVGPPKVSYRETITQPGSFSHLHKKQSGGRGQYAKVEGTIEPLDDPAAPFEYVNGLTGMNVPPEYHSAIEKGFKEAAEKGVIAGHPVLGVRATITDGGYHAVDSSELAFRLATLKAFSNAFKESGPKLLEPVMKVDVECPLEFQGDVVSGVNRRLGHIENVEPRGTNQSKVRAVVPLSKMFGYATDLRSSTQGKGEFSMEFNTFNFVNAGEQAKIVEAFEEARRSKKKN